MGVHKYFFIFLIIFLGFFLLFDRAFRTVDIVFVIKAIPKDRYGSDWTLDVSTPHMLSLVAVGGQPQPT